MTLPNPLHPAVVHLPIALAVVIPAVAVLAVAAIALRLVHPRTWVVILVLQLALFGSARLAIETGEDEEDTVERVVAERYIEDHEDAAERFANMAGLSVLAIGTGLLPGPVGLAGRVLGTAAAVAVLTAGYQVGRSGGELVYEHDAARAYVKDGARKKRGRRG